MNNYKVLDLKAPSSRAKAAGRQEARGHDVETFALRFFTQSDELDIEPTTVDGETVRYTIKWRERENGSRVECEATVEEWPVKPRKRERSKASIAAKTAALRGVR